MINTNRNTYLTKRNVAMNSMQVKCVIALGKTKSYTKTAEDLYVSQSTVSKNISRLEEELGFKIVKVKGHQVEFTDQGQFFYEHLDKIHQNFEETLSNIYSFDNQRPIIVRHSMVPFERFYIPRFLQLTKKSSKRQIKIEGFRPYNSYEDNIDLFYENKADFILIQQDFFHGDKRLGFTPLMNGQYSVIVNKQSPLAEKQYIDINDLIDQHIYIWNSNPGVGSVLEIEKILKKKLKKEQISEVTGLISAEMYATANYGVGIVPSFAYDNQNNSNVAYNYLNLHIPLVYGAFYLKSTEKQPYFKNIIQNLKRALTQEKAQWH